MEATESERFEASVITVKQMIDICLSPFHIDVNLLHILLNIIVSKLSLQSVRIHLGPPALLADINNLIAKSKETFEAYRVLEGGDKKPFKLGVCKLEKVDIEPEIPVDTFYKITKYQQDAKDFHKVTFFKDTPVTQNLDQVPGVSQEGGYTYAELLNLTKRLEGCEIGIEKLTQLLQKINCNYKDLERSFIEIASKDQLRVQEYDQQQQTTVVIDDGHLLGSAAGKEDTKESQHSQKECATTDDISQLKDILASLIDQINSMLDRIALLEDLLKALQRENESLRRDMEKATDQSKLDSCIKEICCMQKTMARLSNKMADLIACSNRNNEKFISINDQLKQFSKFRSSQEKIVHLEESTQYLASEFENFTELYEQIKVIKADREELDYVNQRKADKDQLLDLVPVHLFNAVKTDLSNGIVQVFDYIMQVEMNLRTGLEDIMSTRLQDKLDKSEKLAITKLVNDKLSGFQEKFSQALGSKFDAKSPEARVRALKDLNCTCYITKAEVVCNVPSIPKFQHIRRNQNVCPEVPEPRKRNCGGSHTVLNAEQRLAQRRTSQPYGRRDNDPPILMPGTSGAMHRVSPPDCKCSHEKFPKYISPTAKSEVKEKKLEETKPEPDSQEVKK